MRLIMMALATAATLALFGGPALAGKKVKPDKITCEEFLDLNEQVQPRMIYYLVGYNRAGKPEAAEFDVEDLVRPVATTVVEECKQAPKATLWEKIKSKF